MMFAVTTRLQILLALTVACAAFYVYAVNREMRSALTGVRRDLDQVMAALAMDGGQRQPHAPTQQQARQAPVMTVTVPAPKPAAEQRQRLEKEEEEDQQGEASSMTSHDIQDILSKLNCGAADAEGDLALHLDGDTLLIVEQVAADAGSRRGRAEEKEGGSGEDEEEEEAAGDGGSERGSRRSGSASSSASSGRRLTAADLARLASMDIEKAKYDDLRAYLRQQGEDARGSKQALVERVRRLREKISADNK